jgi:hypothetical protein
MAKAAKDCSQRINVNRRSSELFPPTFCICLREVSSPIPTPTPTVAERSMFSLTELKGMNRAG